MVRQLGLFYKTPPFISLCHNNNKNYASYNVGPWNSSCLVKSAVVALLKHLLLSFVHETLCGESTTSSSVGPRRLQHLLQIGLPCAVASGMRHSGSHHQPAFVGKRTYHMQWPDVMINDDWIYRLGPFDTGFSSGI